jgi:hypothetical protein
VSDLLSIARTSLAAATGKVTPRVRALHLAVSRSSLDKLRREADEFEVTLKAAEAQLEIEGIGVE